jgi:polysaccharide export outer membrane protein
MRSTILILSLAAAAFAPGCATTRQNDARDPALAEEHAMNASLRRLSKMPRPVAGDYVIDPPDVIEIVVKDQKELSATAIRVGPDGRVARPLVGAIQVGGRTVAEVQAELKARYAKYIKDVDVTVLVTGFHSKWIYVDGEVRNPGRYPYTGSDSVVNALSQAGFLTRAASPNGVHVARGNPNDPEIYPVRYKDILVDDDSRTNWLLAPEDIVYVPPTFMRKVGYAMEDIFSPFNALIGPAAAANGYGEYRDRRDDR